MSIRDRVQAGMGDEGWAMHTDGSFRYRGRVTSRIYPSSFRTCLGYIKS